MTKLIDQISATRVNLRGDESEKAKAEYSILTLLVGELQTASKRDGSEITDEKVIAAARKLIKSNNETHKLKPSLKLIQENQVLEQFLPVQLSEEKLRSELQFSHTTIPFTGVGEAMAFLAEKFPGQYDRGLASRVAKELF